MTAPDASATPHRLRIAAAKLAVALGLVAATAGGIAALHWRASVRAAVPPSEPLPVSARPLALESGYAVVERFTGRLDTRRATALAFERDGLVHDVLVDEGDAVSAGQTVARLDTALLEAARAARVAERAQVEAEYALAERTMERQARLAGDGHASQQRYDEARFGAAALEARLASLDAEIRRIDIEIDKSTLRAPFAGHVTARRTDEGAVVELGTAIVELIETGAIEARVGVPPGAVPSLTVGAVYALEIGGRGVAGRLRRLRPDLGMATRTVTALFDVEADAVTAPPGELVRLAVERRIETPGAWLPLAALRENSNGLWTVLTVAGGRVGQEAVEALHVADGQAFVRGTWSADTLVVDAGPNRVVPGQPVALAAN